MIAEAHKSQLKRIKKAIETAHISFKPNNLRYHEFQKFVFETNLTTEDEQALDNLGKPIIQFNMLNAFVSRLCGEFSKQEPSIQVMAEFGTKVDPLVMEVVEGHIRHILFEAAKRNTQYSVYKDQISGGFSCFKIATEYADEMSFDQVIEFSRAYEPTLTGFDPTAREVTKCDGQFCFEIYPMPREDFEREYPDIDLDGLSFIRDEDSFNWSFSNDKKQDVVVVCDYYEKKKRRAQIVKLADKKVMELKEYEKFVEEWNAIGLIEQPPAVIGEPRWTSIEKVVRYRLIGSEIIEYKKTIFKQLPLVFVDGDSVIIQDGSGGAYRQFTKPYVYHAKGIQRLINFSGQTIGNDFESMVMHKFMVAQESLPDEDEWMEAYRSPQVASVIVYRAYDKVDTNKQLPPPREISRVPLPQEVLAIFNSGMQQVQNILGSFNAAIGVNNNDISGKAMIEAATNSNNAALPYAVSHLQALTQCAQIFVDLIPKLYKTPRTIPVLNKDGTRTYQKVGDKEDPESMMFNYDENALSVRVEAGASFQVEKTKALQQIIALMNSSEQFAQFMNTEGMDIMLKNMEFMGSDIIAERAREWMKEVKEQKERMKGQPSPEEMQMQLQQKQMQLSEQSMQQKAMNDQQKIQNERAKIMQNTQDSNIKATVDVQKVIVDKQKADNDRLKIMQQAGESRGHLIVGLAKAEAEEQRARADMHMKHYSMGHSMHLNTAKLISDVHNKHEDREHKKNATKERQQPEND